MVVNGSRAVESTNSHSEEIPAVTAGGAGSFRRLLRGSPLWLAVDIVLLLVVLSALVTVVLQVATRLLGSSVSWTEELTRFLFIWTAFLGAASGFRHADHVRVTLFLRILPPAARRAAVHLYVLAGILFFSTLGYYGAQLVLQKYRSGEISPVLTVGMFIIALAVPVSAALAIVGHIQSAYFDAETRSKLERSEEVLE